MNQSWLLLAALGLGCAGESGAVGEQGPPGADGVRGPQGDEGPAGVQGDEGPAGSQGAPGAPGTPGVGGISWEDSDGVPVPGLVNFPPLYFADDGVVWPMTSVGAFMPAMIQEVDRFDFTGSDCSGTRLMPMLPPRFAYWDAFSETYRATADAPASAEFETCSRWEQGSCSNYPCFVGLDGYTEAMTTATTAPNLSDALPYHPVI